MKIDAAQMQRRCRCSCCTDADADAAQMQMQMQMQMQPRSPSCFMRGQGLRLGAKIIIHFETH